MDGSIPSAITNKPSLGVAAASAALTVGKCLVGSGPFAAAVNTSLVGCATKSSVGGAASADGSRAMAKRRSPIGNVDGNVETVKGQFSNSRLLL